jgi:ornithine cyclodeaminase
MSNLLVLSAEDVDSIISHLEPKALQLLMAHVFSQFADIRSKTSISQPHRLSFPMLNHTALFMPARIGNAGISAPGHTAIKVVCVPHDSSDPRGLPATTMVLDESTGNVKAIVNARRLTALRNAAGPYSTLSLLVHS